MSQAGLYVVATPIGNLEDISYRAVRILSEVDLIAAEDTRHSRLLLSHYDIKTNMWALHEHNEDRMTDRLLERLVAGEAIALISDAGTPLISDPGFRLVRAARKAGLPVFSIPGPSAITAALSISGISPDRFAFEGFLPAKALARQRKLASLLFEDRTLIFFESSHRVADSINDMVSIFGTDRIAAMCRELTKKFETVLRGSLGEIRQWQQDDINQLRGEFVLVVEGFSGNEDKAMADAHKMLTALMEYLPASQAARIAARLNDVSRRKLYQMIDKIS